MGFLKLLCWVLLKWLLESFFHGTPEVRFTFCIVKCIKPTCSETDFLYHLLNAEKQRKCKDRKWVLCVTNKQKSCKSNVRWVHWLLSSYCWFTCRFKFPICCTHFGCSSCGCFDGHERSEPELPYKGQVILMMNALDIVCFFLSTARDGQQWLG